MQRHIPSWRMKIIDGRKGAHYIVVGKWAYGVEICVAKLILLAIFTEIDDLIKSDFSAVSMCLLIEGKNYFLCLCQDVAYLYNELLYTLSDMLSH